MGQRMHVSTELRRRDAEARNPAPLKGVRYDTLGPHIPHPRDAHGPTQGRTEGMARVPTRIAASHTCALSCAAPTRKQLRTPTKPSKRRRLPRGVASRPRNITGNPHHADKHNSNAPIHLGAPVRASSNHARQADMKGSQGDSELSGRIRPEHA